MDEQRAKAFEELLKGSFSFGVDVSGFFVSKYDPDSDPDPDLDDVEVFDSDDPDFDSNCVDYEDFDTDDFDLMVPVIAKYGQTALLAYAAIKRNYNPTAFPCGHNESDYQAAKAEIEAIKKANKSFMWTQEDSFICLMCGSGTTALGQCDCDEEG